MLSVSLCVFQFRDLADFINDSKKKHDTLVRVSTLETSVVGLEKVMKNFSPDLVLVSAGFDGHIADPLGHLMLTDVEYAYLTARLLDAARATGGGRLVSCLEGGYNLRTLGGTVRTHVAALG